MSIESELHQLNKLFKFYLSKAYGYESEENQKEPTYTEAQDTKDLATFKDLATLQLIYQYLQQLEASNNQVVVSGDAWLLLEKLLYSNHKEKND
jgi:hypothetical protein